MRGGAVYKGDRKPSNKDVKPSSIWHWWHKRNLMDENHFSIDGEEKNAKDIEIDFDLNLNKPSLPMSPNPHPVIGIQGR